MKTRILNPDSNLGDVYYNNRIKKLKMKKIIAFITPKNAKLVFVTGACGSGKTSTIPYLREAFPVIDTHDFDEKGVPYPCPIQWRVDTTEYWLNVARQNATNGISTIITGVVMPQEIERFPIEIPIIYCLLDITKEKERVSRLQARGAHPDLIVSNQKELLGLRAWFKNPSDAHIVIDTADITIPDL